MDTHIHSEMYCSGVTIISLRAHILKCQRPSTVPIHIPIHIHIHIHIHVYVYVNVYVYVYVYGYHYQSQSTHSEMSAPKYFSYIEAL